jgi:hypothetical protein
MNAVLWLLWALFGGAVATWVMMHIWLPDPPPDVLVKFIGILFAGVAGGLVGGSLVHTLAANSTPMPGILGAATVGLIISGGVAILGGAGRKSVR